VSENNDPFSTASIKLFEAFPQTFLAIFAHNFLSKIFEFDPAPPWGDAHEDQCEGSFEEVLVFRIRMGVD
jgi:hypothetical protein